MYLYVCRWTFTYKPTKLLNCAAGDEFCFAHQQPPHAVVDTSAWAAADPQPTAVYGENIASFGNNVVNINTRNFACCKFVW